MVYLVVVVGMSLCLPEQDLVRFFVLAVVAHSCVREPVAVLVVVALVFLLRGLQVCYT